METPKISYKRCFVFALAIFGAALAFQTFLTSYANAAAWRWGWAPQSGLFDTKKVNTSLPEKAVTIDEKLKKKGNWWAVVPDVVDAIEGTRAYVDHAIDLREAAITAELKRKFPAYMQGIAGQVENKINSMDSNINTVLINSAAASNTIRVLQSSVETLTDRVAELEKQQEDIKDAKANTDKIAALGIAMSSIDFISVSGKFSAAGSFGQVGKQFAGAAGLAYTLESGNVMISVKAAAAKTKFAFGFGAALLF